MDGDLKALERALLCMYISEQNIHTKPLEKTPTDPQTTQITQLLRALSDDPTHALHHNPVVITIERRLLT
jgi:hypothetical protein